MIDSVLNSLRRLEAIIEYGNDLVAIINADGLYSYVGPSVKRILNIEPEAFIRKSLFEFIHPDDTGRIHSHFDAILTTDKPVYIEPFRFSDMKGSWHWVETYATNRINDPIIRGIIANSRDITDKVELEQERLGMLETLKASNERYELVIEATRDMIWDMNFMGKSKRVLQAIKSKNGFDNDIVDDSSWPRNIHPDDKEKVLESIEDAILNPDTKSWQKEYRYINPDGSVSYISDQGFIIRNGYNEATRIVGAMHDITGLKEHQLEVLKQNEKLREIASISSHQIRRPVASILGLMSLLDRKALNGTSNAEIIEYLEKATHELDEIITNIIYKTVE